MQVPGTFRVGIRVPVLYGDRKLNFQLIPPPNPKITATGYFPSFPNPPSFRSHQLSPSLVTLVQKEGLE